jgi:hypothetical protein
VVKKILQADHTQKLDFNKQGDVEAFKNEFFWGGGFLGHPQNSGFGEILILDVLR